MASDGRSYVNGYFQLDMDGFNCGIIQKFSGGESEGEVATLPMAHDYFVKKQIGNLKYSDFEVQVGLSMAEPLQDWIESSLNMQFKRKSGELKAADFQRQTRHIREFKDALLTKIVFPAGDGAAKEAAFATLGFSPWRVDNRPGDGSTVSNPVDVRQKEWHPSDFNFTVDGLDRACSKISKFEAIEIKQSVVTDFIGREREYFREPGKIDFPNIKITMSEDSSHAFFDWYRDFVVAGRNTDADHKTGSVSYLNRTREKELLTLDLYGLGIYKISAAPRNHKEDKIASVTVEMYCESIGAKFA